MANSKISKAFKAAVVSSVLVASPVPLSNVATASVQQSTPNSSLTRRERLKKALEDAINKTTDQKLLAELNAMLNDVNSFRASALTPLEEPVSRLVERVNQQQNPQVLPETPAEQLDVTNAQPVDQNVNSENQPLVPLFDPLNSSEVSEYNSFDSDNNIPTGSPINQQKGKLNNSILYQPENSQEGIPSTQNNEFVSLDSNESFSKGSFNTNDIDQVGMESLDQGRQAFWTGIAQYTESEYGENSNDMPQPQVPAEQQTVTTENQQQDQVSAEQQSQVPAEQHNEEEAQNEAPVELHPEEEAQNENQENQQQLDEIEEEDTSNEEANKQIISVPANVYNGLENDIESLRSSIQNDMRQMGISVETPVDKIAEEEDDASSPPPANDENIEIEEEEEDTSSSPPSTVGENERIRQLEALVQELREQLAEAQQNTGVLNEVNEHFENYITENIGDMAQLQNDIGNTIITYRNELDQSEQDQTVTTENQQQNENAKPNQPDENKTYANTDTQTEGKAEEAAEQKAQYEEQVKQLQEELDEAEKKVKEAAEAEERAKEAAEQNAQLEARVQRLKEQLTEANKKINNLTAQNTFSEIVIKSKAECLEEQNKAKREADLKIQTLQKELDEAKKKLDAAEEAKQRAELSAKAKEEKAKNMANEKESSLKNEIQQLKEQLNETRNSYLHSKGEANHHKQTADTLFAQNVDLNVKIKELEEKLKAATQGDSAEVEALKKEINELKEQLNTLSQEAVQLHTQLSNANARIAQLQNEQTEVPGSQPLPPTVVDSEDEPNEAQPAEAEQPAEEDQNEANQQPEENQNEVQQPETTKNQQQEEHEVENDDKDGSNEDGSDNDDQQEKNEVENDNEETKSDKGNTSEDDSNSSSYSNDSSDEGKSKHPTEASVVLQPVTARNQPQNTTTAQGGFWARSVNSLMGTVASFRNSYRAFLQPVSLGQQSDTNTNQQHSNDSNDSNNKGNSPTSTSTPTPIPDPKQTAAPKPPTIDDSQNQYLEQHPFIRFLIAFFTFFSLFGSNSK